MATPGIGEWLSRLLAPGERMGWSFRDRNLFRQLFLAPEPNDPPPPTALNDKLGAARANLFRWMRNAAAAGAGGGLLAGCYMGIKVDVGSALELVAALTLVGGIGGAGIILTYYGQLKRKIADANADRQQRIKQARADWAARKAEFERADRDRTEQLLEWSSVPPGPASRRVDIVGGNLWGWEALLTVFGSSLLSTRGQTTVIDLSGEAVSRELLRVADANGLRVDVLLMPDELGDSDLLAGLSIRELVDTLIESIYSVEESADRVGRSVDDRILTKVCSGLGNDVSMARIAAALRVLMGEPDDVTVLTVEERRFIAEELFGDEQRRQANQRLHRLESFIGPLANLGLRQEARPAVALTCLALATDGRNVRNELLNDLIVQWLIRRIAHESTDLRSLVIAGADEIPIRHIERLSDLCERRNVRLVLMFRHLRGPAVQAIGGGTVGFMRLGNHEEARQAADFIGRDHKFVLSQVTRSLGGNETHTLANAEGHDQSEGHSETKSKSRTVSTETGRTPLGWSFILDGRIPTWSRSKSWSRSETRNWGVTRNWSQTRSVAEGTNWSDTGVQQRVYEYAVEPRALQDLPDYAMILVRRDDTGVTVVPVECNPDIVTLPRVSMEPLPQIPHPRPAHEALPPSLVSPPQMFPPISPPPPPASASYSPPTHPPTPPPPPTWNGGRYPPQQQ